MTKKEMIAASKGTADMTRVHTADLEASIKDDKLIRMNINLSMKDKKEIIKIAEVIMASFPTGEKMNFSKAIRILLMDIKRARGL